MTVKEIKRKDIKETNGSAHFTVTRIFSVFHTLYGETLHVFVHESEGTEVIVHKSLAPTF